MKCWIDTDAGIDDAIGLMIAMSCKDVEIVGISCVHGNVGVDQVVQNVCRVLTLFNRSDIPVYKGSFEPSLSQTIEAGHIHGEDGLGDKPDLHPKYDEIDRSLYKVHVHAVNALIEAAKERHKEIVLITLGPLTNIAMACKFDSQFTSRFQKVLVMGGSESVGNITSHAEYNFHADPEAAHIVFQKFERITLVTWDCCVNHALDPPFLDDLFKNAADKLKLDFVEGITQNLRKLSIQFYGGFVQCDPLAVIVALHPELILKSQTKDCAVELQGFRTRGMSILDNRQFRQLSNRSDEDILKSGNCVIVQQINMVGVEQLFRQMLE